MKKIILVIILIFISTVVKLDANSMTFPTSNSEFFMDTDSGGWITFYGILDYFQNPDGTVEIHCWPPFYNPC